MSRNLYRPSTGTWKSAGRTDSVTTIKFPLAPGDFSSQIAQIPDGRYRFEDVMDNDGQGAENIRIKLEIRVRDGRPVFDFTGSDPQVKGNINSTPASTRASVRRGTRTGSG